MEPWSVILPHPRPFSRGEKGDNPLSLRERVRVRENEV
jgi:hypothetical protein